MERTDKRDEGALLQACGTTPEARAPWLALAEFYAARENWWGVIYAARRGLDCGDDGDALPYDLLSGALYYVGDYPHALAMGEEALKRSPMDGRLRENLRRIRQRLERRSFL